ncbi:hypothetical protein PUN28_006471 [Cardiocondyla obscurior]|uniref:Uncharacterized protein n=1 Tax=Cardiocondyla obscurior TaxID=286306 RepID=A0AAW2GE22_9HYME
MTSARHRDIITPWKMHVSVIARICHLPDEPARIPSTNAHRHETDTGLYRLRKTVKPAAIRNISREIGKEGLCHR